jgi:outer membrane protein TolC
LRVVELYEGLILLRHQIDSDEAFAARMERLWALADAREQQGRASRTDVLRMDFQRGEAEARLEASRSQLDIQFQEFANLLGLPLDAAFRLVPPPLLEFDGVDPVRALAVALAERPDYAQALQDIETGDRRIALGAAGSAAGRALSARQPSLAKARTGAMPGGSTRTTGLSGLWPT